MLTGNAAAAWGARISNVDYVVAYPITPQTEIVETLSTWVREGSMKARFVNFESEHSMFTAAGAASLTGARVFTASSSQGLLYGLEALYSVAGWRAPMVLVNAARGVGMPMVLQVEHGDVFAARDSGFIQLHAETCQEVLDFVLMGYRVAESRRVMLPAIVNMDGFMLSFARERVEVPESDLVREFLPDYEHPSPLLGLEDKPVAVAPTITEGYAYGFFKFQLHAASVASKSEFQEAARDFLRVFGRRHNPVEPFMTDDADYIFVISNSYSSILRSEVRALRAKGEKVGMVSLKMIRPFPRQEVAETLRSAKAVAVYEQNLAPGRGGAIYPEITEAVYHSRRRPDVILPFVGGLGGSSLGRREVEFMLKKCSESLKSGKVPDDLTLLYADEDWQKMKRSLGVAGVTADELEVAKDAGN
jgi:pyruvate ferredoxin oxidoreductase alpha subunit